MGLAKECFPKIKEDMETPEETVMAALKESATCSGSTATAAAEARITATKAFLENPAWENSNAPAVLAAKEQLAQDEALLAKAAKATPFAELELKGLVAAQSKFSEAMQVREDRVKLKAAAAEKRRQERHASLLQMKSQLEEFVKCLADAEAQLTNEHTDRAAARAE